MPIKTVLLTNIYLKNYAGTELNTLETAKELKRQGYQVDVAAFSFGDPIAKHFYRENIPVYELLKNPPIKNQYDLIYANHFPVLTYCLTTAKIEAPKIVFVSNSSIEPVEAPPDYIGNLTYCLTCSQHIISQFLEYGISEEKLRLFPNFLTDEELQYNGKPGKELERLAVISNHVPEIVYQAVDVLREQGISVDIYGVQDTYKRLSAADLVPYDGLVSIGKSIYWALGIGIPAFCYDRFGGPGWITPENIEKAYQYNFSGKGFDRFASSFEELAEEIMSGYKYARQHIHRAQSFIQKECSLSENLKTLMADIEASPPIENPFKGFSKELLERRNQAFAQYFDIGERHRIAQFELNDRITVMTSSFGWKMLEKIRIIYGPIYRLVNKYFKDQA